MKNSTLKLAAPGRALLPSFQRVKTSPFVRSLRLIPFVFSRFHCFPPSLVDIELTNRCDLHCKMCWFYGTSGVGDKYQGVELATNEVFGVIDQIYKHKPQIYLGGAEPLLREDLFVILEYISTHGLGVSFSTNGTLFDQKKIENLVTLGVDQVAFSIDGNATGHDQKRGEGSFRKATSAIKEISVYRRNQRRKKPVIAVNITVTEDNANHLQDAITAIKKATHDGPDIYRIHHLWYVTPKELAEHQSVIRESLGSHAGGAAGHVMMQSHAIDVQALVADIFMLKCQPKVLSFPDFSRQEIKDYYAENKSMKGRCVAPFSCVVIKPNGDVTFCPDEWIDDYVIGNIRCDRFDAIWNNAKARLFRKVLYKKKHFSGCKRCSWMYAC